jgi:hypothetical protein
METRNLLLSVVTVLLLFVSCKKNKDGSSPASTNKFTYDSKEYPLDKAYIHNEVGTRFNVSFFSSGISVNTSGVGGLFIDGKGSGVLLTLDSTIPTDLSSATYKWPSQTTPDLEMIADAQIGISNDITNTIMGTFRSATYGTGSVTVSKSGSQYTIQFSILVDGKTASGKFVGTLQSY